MTKSNKKSDENPARKSLEQRMGILEKRTTTLKKENKELKATLEQRDEGFSEVNRRQMLGIFGGGALLGTAGVSGATSSDSDGDPFANEGHAHNGDYLGKGHPLEQIDVKTLNAKSGPGNIRWAEKGKVQTEINDVHSAGGGTVALKAGEQYDEGKELHVKEDVTLWGSNSTIVVSSDHNGLFLDNGAEAYVSIEVTAKDYSSDAVVWDTSRAIGGRYGYGDDNPAHFYGDIQGPHLATNGNGLAMYADRGISFCEFHGQVRYFRSDVYVEVDGGYVNGNRFSGTFGHSETMFHHAGNGGCQSTIEGTLQPATGGATKYMFLNEAGTARSWTYRGGVPFDGYAVTNSSIRGQNITVFTTSRGPGEMIIDKVDTSYTNAGSIIYIFDRGSLLVGNLNNGEKWEHSWLNSGYEISVNSTEVLKLSKVGDLAIGGSLSTDKRIFNVPRQSLSVNGDVSEVQGTPGLTLNNDFSSFRGTYTNRGTIWWRWDRDYLYIVADLDDNEHVQDEPVGKMWRDDCIQYGISSGKPGEAETWDGGDIGLGSDGPAVFHRIHPSNSNPGVLKSAAAAIVRESGHTRYEVGLPWDALTASPSDEYISLALAIHDVDDGGETNTGWLEWGGGILGGKDNSQFKIAQLTDGTS